MNSPDFPALREALYAAVVADVLDGLGYRHQALGVPLVRTSGQGLLVGLREDDALEEIGGIDPKPYELELKAVDECRQDEVLIVAAAGSTRSGLWGELLSTAAQNRGCAGVVVDGAVRDVTKMDAMGFLSFARGTCPLDSLHRQRVKAIDVPVEIGGVPIHPGDLVFADLDGVVIVPQKVADQTLAQAWKKVHAENAVRDAIRAGAKATEVFERYGVL